MSENTIPTLVNTLRNARRLLGPDWNQRIQAATLLGEASAVEAVSDLKAVALENKHPELAKACIHALGRIHDETAVIALGDMLEYPQDEAAMRLGLDLLLQALKNGSPAASQALAAQSEKLFPDLLNRAGQGEAPARQVILQMGEPGLIKLKDAMLQPETREIASSLLVGLGHLDLAIQCLQTGAELGDPQAQRLLRKLQQ